MFLDRRDAGKKLAQKLLEYKGRAIVLAMPRGGVPVGYKIAEVLGVPLDTIVVRKVGSFFNPEYAIGAIAQDVRVLEESDPGTSFIVRKEEKELQRRMKKYRSGEYVRELSPTVVIVVDDGVATGRSATAALRAAVATYPAAHIVFAASVGPASAVRTLQEEADEVIILEMPANFSAVGEWYESFPQTSDSEVLELLEKRATSSRGV